MTPKAIPQFGELLPGTDYVLRPGGYAIVAGAEGMIAVASTRRGFFLPGGGQEEGESPEEAAVREVHEECGLRIRIVQCLGVADQLALADNETCYYRKRCTFFTAELLHQDGPGEPDHHLVWLVPEAAQAHLAHESQRWAVAEAYGLALADLKSGLQDVGEE
ncbi:MAG TPA: NUDIX domain-containing protein [Thermoanaerobaculia bacterium]|nr:NUDIX domain-containing protein [Thermoanaerobaculia bacterium]